ncbi:ammonium transporter [Capsulimonas corticalis]|uniref:Ammonium transporter n=1 Tax=Capsulimonas corticalis TaxID=2219043 RepID=A0A402CXA9_9BACT|nr:ammonium transporter [Capsulimonas corticalis]BDI32340.1 ammonium transporter [Capsulimonas corticalis]
MLSRFTGLRAACRVLLLALFLCCALTFGGSLHSSFAQVAGDPSGTKTGAAIDATTANGPIFKDQETVDSVRANVPTIATLADGVGHTRVAVNIVFTLLTGFLVMFMQAGFAMVETGFCRAKNAAHVMMTNLMIYPIGVLGFWICGFAIMFGSVGAVGSLGGTPALIGGEFKIGDVGLWGTRGLFLSGNFYDVGVFTLFLFEVVFMSASVIIPTGAMAERWKFNSFIVYGFFASMILYPIYGHQIWGGGWLSQLGHLYHLGHGAVDFAGSGVVHSIGGWTALAGALVLGPRIGKFTNGKANPMPGHDIPMALLGTFILAFGWFGFNPGSTLGMAGAGGMRAAIIAVNTMLASASGAFAALLIWKAMFKKPDPGMAANGMLAGLVAITAPCAYVTSGFAILIGAIAGGLVCWGVIMIEKNGIDDPVGAFSVHGINGIWGVMAVGLFADGTYGDGLNGVSGNVTGLFYGHGGGAQFMAQMISIVVCGAWAFGISTLFFKVQNALTPGGIRSRREDEIAGLDMPEMGAYAYPEFQLRSEVRESALVD